MSLEILRGHALWAVLQTELSEKLWLSFAKITSRSSRVAVSIPLPDQRFVTEIAGSNTSSRNVRSELVESAPCSQSRKGGFGLTTMADRLRVSRMSSALMRRVFHIAGANRRLEGWRRSRHDS